MRPPAQLVAQLRRLAELLRAPASSASAAAPQEPHTYEAGTRQPAAQDARSPPTEAPPGGPGEGAAPDEQDVLKRRRSSAGGFGAGRARRLGAKRELATLTLGVLWTRLHVAC